MKSKLYSRYKRLKCSTLLAPEVMHLTATIYLIQLAATRIERHRNIDLKKVKKRRNPQISPITPDAVIVRLVSRRIHIVILLTKS